MMKGYLSPIEIIHGPHVLSLRITILSSITWTRGYCIRYFLQSLLYLRNCVNTVQKLLKKKKIFLCRVTEYRMVLEDLKYSFSRVVQ